MKFVIEKTDEHFKMRESSNYEILYDEDLDKYGLIVDGIFFTFLTKDQATLLEATWKNRERFESFFNSVGVGNDKLNLQPKAACYDDYERPTGYLESYKRVRQPLKENTMEKAIDVLVKELRRIRGMMYHRAAAELEDTYENGELYDFEMLKDILVANGIPESFYSRFIGN